MGLIIYTDGASRGNPGHGAIGYLIERDGEVLESQGEYLGVTTNNQAEYRALIKALKESKKYKPDEIKHYSDSQLLVKQVMGEWKINEPQLIDLNAEVQKLKKEIKVTHEHVRRNNPGITKCDALANQALDKRSL